MLSFIIQIQHLLKLNLTQKHELANVLHYSNTTLVKVKYQQKERKINNEFIIQIQHLLKLNFNHSNEFRGNA